MIYKKHIIFLMLLLSFLFGCNRPRLTGVAFEEIDTSQDPVQIPFASSEPIIIDWKNGHFTLMPVAKYRLSGVVVSKESYADGWDGKISPIDVAIVWGRLSGSDYRRYVTFSQGSRWYHYQLKEGSPFEVSYVITHSSNNHIIPANENILRAIKSIKKKDKVILEGWLVNLSGKYQGGNVSWTTSLSRQDTGNGSCELFYVSKVRIEAKIYE
jgi:hypothetical protein